EFGGESGRPLLPREISQFGEFDRHGESLRLPWLGEDRSSVVLWQAWQRLEVRFAQGSHPRGQDKHNAEPKLPVPTTLVPRTGLNTHAEVSRRAPQRWYRETHKCRDPDESCRPCRERTAVSACVRSAAYCEREHVLLF